MVDNNKAECGAYGWVSVQAQDTLDLPPGGSYIWQQNHEWHELLSRML